MYLFTDGHNNNTIIIIHVVCVCDVDQLHPPFILGHNHALYMCVLLYTIQLNTIVVSVISYYNGVWLKY